MLTIYKASAGSGKTYNLAKYYIKFLLGIKDKEREARAEDDAERLDVWQLNLDREHSALKINNKHRTILAITFTRKATEEMKQRILFELGQLAKLPTEGESDANYAADMVSDLHCSRSELMLTAQIALQQLLFDYQNFHVSTIDAFFQRVLHTFAREIDMQSDYQVELNDTLAMQTAVGEMLDDFNTSDPRFSSPAQLQLGRWLYEYMRSLIYEGKKSDFLNRDSHAHASLVTLVAQISQESFKQYKDEMDAYLQTDKLNKFVESVDKLKRLILTTIKEDAEAVLLNPADPVELDLLGTSRSNRPQIIARDYLLRGRPWRKMDKWTDTKVMANLVTPDADVSFAPGGGIVQKGETEAHAHAVKGLFERSYARHRVYYAIESIAEALTQLGLLRHAWGYLKRLMEEGNTVLISETNELLAKVIGADDTPFVYERMGLQLCHHLIDEFQDTSTMQWANLLPLVSIGIHDRDDSLIIGDEKQSIYRFRNSDSSILHHGLDEQFDSALLQHKGNIPKENTNFRSSPDIVKFNNTLFTLLAQSLDAEGYENVTQGIHLDHPGHVKFIATEPKCSPDEPLGQMVAEIRRMVDEGGYAYKDIAVLVDTNKQCATAVDFLVANNIPVLSDEALFLYKSWAVQLVINTLKIIDREQSGETKRPDGDEPRLGATNAQMHNVLSQYEIFIKDGASTPAEALDRAMLSLDAQTDAEVGISIERIMSQRPASLAALIETVIKEQIPDPAVRREQSAYLAALQDAAMQFAYKNRGKGASSLHAFLDWWDDNPRLAIGGASEADAVKVMTIHKSKGLEFRCVLIPFCKWQVAWQDGQRTPTIWAGSLKRCISSLNDAASEAGLPTLDVSDAPDALYVRLDKRTRLPESPFFDDFTAEWRLAIADTLNKTYVAFTRAVTELIVWCEVPKNESASDDAGVIGVPIAKAFASGRPEGIPLSLSIDLSECLSDEPGTMLEIGSPTVKVLTDKEFQELADKAERERAALCVDYNVEVRPDAKYIASLKEEQPGIDKPKDAANVEIREEGTLLHEIMSSVRHASDLSRAVRKAASRHALSATQAEEYERMLARFLSDERVKPWFEDFERVYIEQPILIPGSHEETRRPDRVVVNADGSVDVLDYKFGESDGPHQTQHDQVRQYVDLLRQMGHTAVRGFLLYPRALKILPVT